MEYYNMLLPLAIILIVSKLLAKACTKFNLPTVVGLLITGLLMSLIRYIPGQTILDATALDGIGFLAKIGVILIMFETGLETDVKQLRDVGVGRGDHHHGGRCPADGARLCRGGALPRRLCRSDARRAGLLPVLRHDPHGDLGQRHGHNPARDGGASPPRWAAPL